jgi:hypothetical protein
LITLEQVIQAATPGTLNRHLGVPPYLLEPLQENVYCLRSAIQRLFLKWIAADDRYGQNEIHINRQFASTPGFPGPRLLFTVPMGQATLAAWAWAAGDDLRRHQREALPRAFAALGRFHAQQRNTEPVSSPTTHHSYPTVQAMLEDELATLTIGLERAVVAQCKEAFDRLAAGYVTCIHGDLHPGNIRVAADQLQLVDWGYALNSLNLFDLAYVQRHPGLALDATAWWQIGPSEADAVLAAYFATCGMDPVAWEPLHWAVEVWSTLYGYHNASTRQDVAGVTESVARLQVLLADPW